jgi:hypothetical protein
VQATSFPPYELFSRHEGAAQARQEKLERIYHIGQKNIWDGPAVLDELCRKHGRPDLDPTTREAISRIFAIILWGELAAWNISSEIAFRLDDVEAKMAATSQAFDEARHFTVMRDYLRLLGGPPPRLDAYSQTILTELLETDSLLKKLIGMQLLVENIALCLFRAVADARPEPVLGDLMPYYERDEARHVGLGVLELPKLLRGIGPVEQARLVFMQVKINTLIGWGTILQRHDFETIGLDVNHVVHDGTQKQLEILASVQATANEAAGSTRGLQKPDKRLQTVNRYTIDAFLPKPGAELKPWHQRALSVVDSVARLGEAALRRVA